MPDPPDFERIAYGILSAAIAARDSGDPVEARELASIAAQLRRIWNARGAADLVALETTLTSLMGGAASGPYVKTLDQALRKLDR